MCWLVEIDPIFITIFFVLGFLLQIFRFNLYDNNSGKHNKSFYKLWQHILERGRGKSFTDRGCPRVIVIFTVVVIFFFHIGLACFVFLSFHLQLWSRFSSVQRLWVKEWEGGPVSRHGSH